MKQPDAIVVGAGTVGSAIAYGLAQRGLRVVVLDGGDTDFRAARANFGLVWVQGKGKGMPAYQRLSRRSSDLWPAFHERLVAESGRRVDYERNGGLALCLAPDGFEARKALLDRLERERLADDPASGDSDLELVDRAALERLLPGLRLGQAVTGASYCRRDGHVNPLHLLAALQTAIIRLGGAIHFGQQVQIVQAEGDVLAARTTRGVWHAPRLIIAAGIAGGRLGRQIGLDVPITAQRGQVLVTQRMPPMLPLPCSGLRQTAEGTIMIGATKEEVGEDTSATVAASAWLARKTVEIAPDLASATLVRHWSGLRIMTPDGHPVYARSPVHPGAFVTTCHSGVTLAAVHTGDIAGYIADGQLPPALDPFHHRRFHVQAA